MDPVIKHCVYTLQAAMAMAQQVASLTIMSDGQIYVHRSRMLDIAPADQWHFVRHDGGAYCPVWIETTVEGVGRFYTYMSEDQAVQMGIVDWSDLGKPDPSLDPDLSGPELAALEAVC